MNCIRLLVTCFLAATCQSSVFYPDIPEHGQVVSVFESEFFQKDFSDRADFFGPSNSFRARKYLKMARKHYNIATEAGNKRTKAEQEDERLEEERGFVPTMSHEERDAARSRDVFLLVWLASQHINSAITFGASMAGIMAEASDMALGLHQMPGDTSIGTTDAINWASRCQCILFVCQCILFVCQCNRVTVLLCRACHLNASMVSSWLGKQMLHWAETSDFNSHDRLRYNHH